MVKYLIIEDGYIQLYLLSLFSIPPVKYDLFLFTVNKSFIFMLKFENIISDKKNVNMSTIKFVLKGR
jgi:hypothetical protein